MGARLRFRPRVPPSPKSTRFRRGPERRGAAGPRCSNIEEPGENVTPPATTPKPGPDWWVCRGRSHAWPRREDAEVCCCTHTAVCVYGYEPATWPGPEPVVPFTGTGAGHCWVLIPRSEVGSWRAPDGSLPGGQHYGPEPEVMAELSVYTVEHIDRHLDQVAQGDRAWRRRHGIPEPARGFW